MKQTFPRSKSRGVQGGVHTIRGGLVVGDDETTNGEPARKHANGRSVTPQMACPHCGARVPLDGTGTLVCPECREVTALRNATRD